VCVMSVGCYQDWSSTPTLVAASRHNTRCNVPIVVYAAPPEDEPVGSKHVAAVNS
jgi:hypothetical protein